MTRALATIVALVLAAGALTACCSDCIKDAPCAPKKAESK